MARKINRCEKCQGEGWLWWHELDSYHGPARQTGQDDTRYCCDACMGEQEPAVLMQSFDPGI